MDHTGHMDHRIRAPLPVAHDHPAFTGHFPGMPILPGAVLLDTALREISRVHTLDLKRWTVSAKFLAIVRPGDELELEHARAAAGSLRFIIHNGDRPVVTGTLAPRVDAA